MRKSRNIDDPSESAACKIINKHRKEKQVRKGNPRLLKFTPNIFISTESIKIRIFFFFLSHKLHSTKETQIKCP
jgi:hypothetical protein